MANDGSQPLPSSTPQPLPHFPRYIPEDIDLWLMQFEAVCPAGYTSDSKRRVLISLLPPEVLRVLRDALPGIQRSPDPFADLKAQLLSRVAPSREDRISQLLNQDPLGDRTPRQLMTHLLSQLGVPPSGAETPLIRELFIKKLPVSAQSILAATAPTTHCKNWLPSRIASSVIITRRPHTSRLQTQLPFLPLQLHLQSNFQPPRTTLSLPRLPSLCQA